MALRKEKEQALKLRHKGMSYSQIKDKLGISKSTLSYWLADYPLSPERIRELRDVSPKRIESYRNTMRKKREQKFAQAYEEAKKEIGKLSKRDLFIAGFFLYWGEGGKTDTGTLAFANTDPDMLIIFIEWLKTIGIEKTDIKVRVQLYADMNPETEIRYWSNRLQISKRQFRNPYIKSSNRNGLTYKSVHSHGTCNILVYNTIKLRFVLMGIKNVAEQVIESRM